MHEKIKNRSTCCDLEKKKNLDLKLLKIVKPIRLLLGKDIFCTHIYLYPNSIPYFQRFFCPTWQQKVCVKLFVGHFFISFTYGSRFSHILFSEISRTFWFFHVDFFFSKFHVLALGFHAKKMRFFTQTFLFSRTEFQIDNIKTGVHIPKKIVTKLENVCKKGYIKRLFPDFSRALFGFHAYIFFFHV